MDFAETDAQELRPRLRMKPVLYQDIT